jgi:hypothetical protein
MAEQVPEIMDTPFIELNKSYIQITTTLSQSYTLQKFTVTTAHIKPFRVLLAVAC